MQKEKLTPQYIRQDIRSSKKEHIVYVILFSVLLTVVLGAFFWKFLSC